MKNKKLFDVLKMELDKFALLSVTKQGVGKYTLGLCIKFLTDYVGRLMQ